MALSEILEAGLIFLLWGLLSNMNVWPTAWIRLVSVYRSLEEWILPLVKLILQLWRLSKEFAKNNCSYFHWICRVCGRGNQPAKDHDSPLADEDTEWMNENYLILLGWDNRIVNIVCIRSNCNVLEQFFIINFFRIFHVIFLSLLLPSRLPSTSFHFLIDWFTLRFVS